MPTQQDAQAAEAKKKQEEDSRQEMLAQLLSPDAKERLSRIALVKADKARKLEDMVIMMARQGRLKAQLTDNMLKEMLEQVGGDEGSSKAGITFDRRRYADDDDDEIDLSGF